MHVLAMLVPALAMLVPLGPAQQLVQHRQHHARARAAPRCAAPPSGPRRKPNPDPNPNRKKRLSEATPADVAKEKHLFFDEVALSVRGGQGGHGAAFHLPKVGKGAKLGRTADGDFALPEGGGRGGSVVLEVDTSLQDLLHLHGRPLVAAPRGADSAGLNQYRKVQRQQREASYLSNVDQGDFDGEARGNVRARAATPTNIHDARELVIPVPPGTFVRTKGGKVLGDLVSPRQRLVVAEGGGGGPCVLKDNPATGGGKKGGKGEREGDDEFAMTDDEMDEMVQGQPGQAATLQLMLRTVADVGFVGFPNAGKSTLLAALTRAAPEVAPFPFTTLMPNLGALADTDQSRPAVLADLPGLIEGASYGRGLGRQFLRHLRRVQVVLYVLDTTSDTAPAGGADGADAERVVSAAEAKAGEVGEALGEGEATAGVGANGTAWPTAIEQYEALRRELYLYNPDYLARPHIVALNKLDLPLQRGGQPAFDEARARLSQQIAASAAAAASQTAPPIAIVPLSGLRGKGLRIMKDAISRALAASDQGRG